MSIRAKYLRSYFFELTRILNHIMRLLHMQLMLCIDTIFMGFEERETIMNFMNGLAVPDYTLRNFRPGGVSCDVPEGLFEDICKVR